MEARFNFWCHFSLSKELSILICLSQNALKNSPAVVKTRTNFLDWVSWNEVNDLKQEKNLNDKKVELTVLILIGL